MVPCGAQYPAISLMAMIPSESLTPTLPRGGLVFGITVADALHGRFGYYIWGEEVSSREIKTILSECVANENKRKPMTDEALMEVLNQKGYQIARRTVAKYREMLGIPVARMRKEY